MSTIFFMVEFKNSFDKKKVKEELMAEVLNLKIIILIEQLAINIYYTRHASYTRERCRRLTCVEC